MREPVPDDAPIEAPFEPPTSLLVRRTIRAVDAETAERRSAALRQRMRAKGIRLIALSSRATPRAVIVELVFSPRSWPRGDVS